MSIKKRVMIYLDYKKLSRYKFYKITGLSNGFLDKEGSITSDKCEMICKSFPEINPLWLLTGEGYMLRNNYSVNKIDLGQVEEPVPDYQTGYLKALIEKIVELSTENANLKNRITRLKIDDGDSGVIEE
jgi:hypothetical protein